MSEENGKKEGREAEELRIGREKNASLLFIASFFAFTVACMVFGILCILNARLEWMQNNRILFVVLSVVLLCALFGLCVWFTLTKMEAWVKTALSGYILLLFVLILLFVFLKTGFFEMVSTPESLQEYLKRAGVWMPIVYILLQYLQVVILPIPSVVSTVAGVALFGPLQTIFYSLLGILPASATAFFVGRKLGNKAVAWMIGEDTLNRWQEKLKGKDNLLLTMMFLLPMFPDDVLCFVAGLSSMSTKYFFAVIAISRILVVTGTCYSFEFIPLNTWWGLLIWIIFIAAIVTIFILAYKNMDKLQAWIQERKKEKKK